MDEEHKKPSESSSSAVSAAPSSSDSSSSAELSALDAIQAHTDSLKKLSTANESESAKSIENIENIENKGASVLANDDTQRKGVKRGHEDVVEIDTSAPDTKKPRFEGLRRFSAPLTVSVAKLVGYDYTPQAYKDSKPGEAGSLVPRTLGTINKLPADVLLLIASFDYLSLKDLINLMKTNKDFYKKLKPFLSNPDLFMKYILLPQAKNDPMRFFLLACGTKNNTLVNAAAAYIRKELKLPEDGKPLFAEEYSDVVQKGLPILRGLWNGTMWTDEQCLAFCQEIVTQHRHLINGFTTTNPIIDFLDLSGWHDVFGPNVAEGCIVINNNINEVYEYNPLLHTITLGLYSNPVHLISLIYPKTVLNTVIETCCLSNAQKATIITYLLKNGADPYRKHRFENSSLFYTLDQGLEHNVILQLIEYMQDKGTSIFNEILCYDGVNPSLGPPQLQHNGVLNSVTMLWYFLFQKNDYPVAEFLIQHQADVNYMTLHQANSQHSSNFQETLLDTAYRLNNQQAIDLLTRYSAKRYVELPEQAARNN
jgi:hypothetical protein